jgi:hypothetical protein
MGNEKRTRALLAEMGIPPESAAVSLKATKEALLKCMPGSEADAATAEALFQAAAIPTRTTGQSALKELLAAGVVWRIRKGGKGDPFRYFAKPALPAPPNRFVRGKQHSKAILAALKGESGPDPDRAKTK